MSLLKKALRLFLIIFMFVSIGSCASTRRYELVDDYRNFNISRIAVLPPSNLTADLDAPKLFRPIVESGVRSRGYEVIPAKEIDDKLAELGVHYAGQLAEFTPSELGEILGADALLYTTVTDLKTLYLVAYVQITVGGRFELVDAKTEKQLWLWEDEVTDIRIATRREELMGTALFILMPYKPYIEILVQKAFNTLPIRRR